VIAVRICGEGPELHARHADRAAPGKSDDLCVNAGRGSEVRPNILPSMVAPGRHGAHPGHPQTALDGSRNDGSQPARLLRLGRRHRNLRDRRAKLVADPEAASERIYEHSLLLEDARAYAAYGQNSVVGKILEIHQETPGRIHVVLIRQVVGF
jgi:hypothetical protein